MAKDTIAKLVKEKGKQKPGGKRGTGTLIDRSKPVAPNRIRSMTPQQLTAVNIYFENGFKKKEAAMAAGYSEVSANHIWNKFQIRAEIDRRMKKMESERKKVKKKFAITQENIIKEMAKIAFAPIENNIPHITQEGVEVFQPGEQDPEIVELLGHLPAVSARDKKGALDSLAKIEGMFTERIQIDSTDDIVARILIGRQRLALEGEVEDGG